MSDLVHAEYLGISKVNNHEAITFNWISPKRKHQQWLAMISGICPKYGFKRDFVDKQEAPVKQNPNLRAYRWILPQGAIFQYKNFLLDYLSDKVASGYFLTLKDGIISLEEEQVRQYLNLPIKGGKIVRMPSFQPSQDGFIDDDVPF